MFKSCALIISFFSILYIVGCEKKSETLYVYEKPVEEKLDPTASYIKDENNFFKPEYESVFNKLYEKEIKASDFKQALKILNYVAANAMRFQSYNPFFKDKLVYFQDNYLKYITDKTSLKFINLYLGKYYADKSNFEKAIEYYTLGTKHKVFDYKSCYAKAINFRNIAWCYYCLGNSDLAIQNNIKALELLKQTDRKDLLGGVYFNLYPIYLSLKDYKNAELNLNKASSYYKLNKEKNLTNIFICLHNKIQLYNETKQVEKRRKLVDSTLIAFEKSGLDDSSVKISLQLSKFKMKLDDLKIDEAEKILESLKPDIVALNSEYNSKDYNIALAILEIKKTGIQNTNIILDAIPTLKENKDFQNVLNAYLILHDDSSKKKDYEKALNYYYLYQQAADSINGEKMRSKIAELETIYETQKKQQQIVVQEKTILNKNTTIALLVFIILGLFLSVVLHTTIQKQKKLQLEKVNAQQYTKQLLEKTEEERKRIASDLHDSVSHELLSLKNSFEEKNEITNLKIDAIINDIRIISRNLHPILFDKIGLQASIEQLVERAQTVNDFMVTAYIDYKPSLSTNVELQVYRIVQEALSNIIKYANAVAAKISILDQTDTVFIEIKDNGKGFNVAETMTAGNAFGIYNIIERSRAIGGEAKIHSDAKGTIITIEIKKTS